MPCARKRARSQSDSFGLAISDAVMIMEIAGSTGRRNLDISETDDQSSQLAAEKTAKRGITGLAEKNIGTNGRIRKNNGGKISPPVTSPRKMLHGCLSQEIKEFLG